MTSSEPWWQTDLEKLNHEQWEQLCDGCGLCCLHKLEDEQTGDIHYTELACELLDTTTCECRHYQQRSEYVPGCLQLTPANYRQALPWLPDSCAYKRVANRQPLPSWHHLLTGDKTMMHKRNASVSGKVMPATGIAEQDYQDYILRWIDLDDEPQS